MFFFFFWQFLICLWNISVFVINDLSGNIIFLKFKCPCNLASKWLPLPLATTSFLWWHVNWREGGMTCHSHEITAIRFMLTLRFSYILSILPLWHSLLKIVILKLFLLYFILGEAGTRYWYFSVSRSRSWNRSHSLVPERRKRQRGKERQKRKRQ